jgi:ATP-dependent Clp protease ATP-binding subunit ClpA
LPDGKLSNQALYILNQNICSWALPTKPIPKRTQLFSLTAHTENFRQQLTPHSSTKHSASVDLPLSNAGKGALAYAAEEADKLASKPIGTQHLLLGLLRERKSEVPETLAAVGINLHSARNRIREAQGLPILDREPDD